MRGEKYFLMLVLMIFSILGTITMMGSLPGFYFAIELYVMIFFMLVVSVSAYFIQEKSKWGWRLGALFFASSIVNILFLFYLSPHPTLIVLTILSSAGYIIALDHLNEGRLVFQNFDLTHFDFSRKLYDAAQRGQFGVLDEDAAAVRSHVANAIEETRKQDDWQPIHHTDEERAISVDQTEREILRDMQRKLENNSFGNYYDGFKDPAKPASPSPEVPRPEPTDYAAELDQKYEDVIKKRDYGYYKSDTQDDGGLQNVTVDDLDTMEAMDLGGRDFEVTVPKVRQTMNVSARQTTLNEPKKRRPKRQYLASPLSSKFHRIDCKWIARLNRKDAVRFESVKQAVREGYQPCSCVDKDVM